MTKDTYKGRHAVAKRSVGEKLQALRLAHGLSQKNLGEDVLGIDALVVSRWENGKELRRFIRHAPRLFEFLGGHIWSLVYEAAEQVHRRDDWEWCGPIAKAITAALAERSERVPANTLPVTYRLSSLPTLDEIAARAGLSTPLSFLAALSLAERIRSTDLTRGWVLMGREQILETQARRRTARSRLVAESGWRRTGPPRPR